MSKKPKLTHLHYFQVMDRTSGIADIIDKQLIQSPVCKLDKEVGSLVDEAMNKLHTAYLLIGDRYNEMLKNNDI